MKFISFTLIAIIVVPFLSCKSNSTNPSNGIPSQTIQATVNGVQWKSSDNYVSGITNPSIGTTTIKGEEDEPVNGGVSKYWITLTFHKTDTGKYNAVGIAEYDDIMPNQIVIGSHYADTGSVYISQTSSSNIVGTFNFISKSIGIDTITVTNGSFNVNIQ